MPRLSACASGTARPVGRCRRRSSRFSAGTRTVLERQPAASAVIPARLRLLGDGEAGRVAWHQKQRRALVGPSLDGDQLGDRRVGDAILGAVDDPIVAAADSFGGQAHGRGRPVIVDAERGIVARLAVRPAPGGSRRPQGRRRKRSRCSARHRGEQQPAERTGLRQHRGDVGIADRQLLGDDAAGQAVGADAAELLRQAPACAAPFARPCAARRSAAGGRRRRAVAPSA